MAGLQSFEQGFAVPSIEVDFWPATAPAFAAVVRLHGEHDLATSASLREALAPIDGSVLLDLSDCAFVDSTVITACILDARDRAVEGHRLELAVEGAEPSVIRTLEVSGLMRLVPVYDPRALGLL